MNNLKESEFADYLFTSKSSNSAFEEVENTFYQLNDYCVHLLQSLQEKFKDIESTYSEEAQTKAWSEMGDADYIGSFEEFAEELGEKINISTYKFGPNDTIDFWSENVNFIAPTNILVLLYFYTEGCLKNLCKKLNVNKKDNVVRLRPTYNKSKIEAAFEYLKNNCNISYYPSEDVKVHLKEVNKIRNNFAHGDWDLLKDRMKKINLRNSFKIASSIFADIENIYLNNKK